MSLVNVQPLQSVPVCSQKSQISFSSTKDKNFKVPSLSNSTTNLFETTIFFNNGLTDRKKQDNSSPTKFQRAILFAKKTLSQLQHKKKMRQNQIKISKIKQKCSKLLTSSKSTNGSSEYNSKHDAIVASKHSVKNNDQAMLKSTGSKRDQKRQIKIEPNGKEDSNHIYFKTARGYETFNILKYINGGAFGKVYLAQNMANFAVFSIKIIPRSVMTKDIEYQLFREIKIQMFLDHPNIIKLYHFYVDSQNVYLVLEPCLGDDLYKNLKAASENLTEKQMSKIVKQVCQAVEFMHKHDVIHRDIKPQNVLIHENVVKVCDFGWAIFSPLLRITQCGTPLYSSPEMLKKELYDSKIDVWCIGVLAYEIFYGTIPFEIRKLEDLQKIVEEELYFPKKVFISREAKSFIMACMDKNPYHRYNIQQALEHPFLNGCERYRCTIA